MLKYNKLFKKMNLLYIVIFQMELEKYTLSLPRLNNRHSTCWESLIFSKMLSQFNRNYIQIR